MAKPCTPHPIAQRVQSFKLQTGNVSGVEGEDPLAFLWGFQKGYSLWKENTPFGWQQRHALHHHSAQCADHYAFVRSYETTTLLFGSVPMENVVTLGVSWSAVWMTWRS